VTNNCLLQILTEGTNDMIGSAYIILTCLAGFYTLCLTKSAAIKTPKPFMKQASRVATVDAANGKELVRTALAGWGHSSTFSVGIAWESNSAGIADHSGHHYAFGPSADEGPRFGRYMRFKSAENSVLRFPVKRAEEESQGRDTLPPAA
jgi:hypothetical protein